MTTDTPNPKRISQRLTLAFAGAALFAGGAGSAWVAGATRPAIAMAPSRPVAINALATGNDVVLVRGTVGQVFADHFELIDATGKAIVQTGRGWSLMPLVATGQSVAVQGRFANGYVHAAFLVGADGKVVALRGHDGPGRPHGPGGPGRKDRHDDRIDGPQSAPVAAAVNAVSPVANATAP